MKRRVEGALRRLLTRDLGQPIEDLLEREWVASQKPGMLLDERERAGRGLLVPLDRSRLTPPDDAVVGDRNLNDLCHVL